MADHAELQILRAMQSLLLQAPWITPQIDLNRTLPYGDADQLPALNLHYGDDEPGTQTVGYIDSVLTVAVEVAVVGDDDSNTQVLSDIRRDVHKRLMTNRTLGLGFVHDVRYSGVSEPEIEEADAELPVVRRRLNWSVHYRTDLTDPSTFDGTP